MVSVPKEGSFWVLDLDGPPAQRKLVRVEEVRLGEKVGWKVHLTKLSTNMFRDDHPLKPMELTDFWRSITPVGDTINAMSEMRSDR